jgi:DNA-binding beta-propeller fold protein YncE
VLYLVDNNTSTSRILRVAVTGTTGTVTVLAGPSVQLGLADGIEIDEGGNRLLIASETAGGGRLLAVDRDSGSVTALANIEIDVGFFPTGVVYDRLGTAVVRERDDATSLRGHSVAP